MIPGVLRRIYHRAFVERIIAIVNRLDTMTVELNRLRGEIEQLRMEVRDVRTNVGVVQEERRAFERQVETVIASRWDSTALARRLATLEDRIVER